MLNCVKQNIEFITKMTRDFRECHKIISEMKAEIRVLKKLIKDGPGDGC